MPAWLVLPAVLCTPLLVLERLLPHGPTGTRPWQRRVRNLTMWLLSQALPLGGLVAASATLVPDAAPLRLLQSSGTPLPVLVLLETLLLDALHYPIHVTAHRLPWIWRFHAVHHADDALDATTGLLQHPGEHLLFALLQLPVVVLLGISPLAVSIYAVILLGFGLFHHGNLRLPPWLERSIGRFVVTPAFHRPHHHRHRPHTDTNFGFVLSVWDRWFNTKGVEGSESVPGFSPGLDEHPAMGLRELLARPFHGLLPARRRDAARLPQPDEAPRLGTGKVDCIIMRGGTSKGLFFRRSDLAADHAQMLDQLRHVIGAGSPRGVDGLGGLDPLANKLAVVGRSTDGQADLDYWFAQVADLQQGRIDESVSCGNILAAVGPFAAECGLVKVGEASTTLRIRCLNTGQLVRVSFAARHGRPVYEGDLQLAGVPGSGAPIELDYASTRPLPLRQLFPGGQRVDQIDGVRYTLIRCATTLLVARAEDFGIVGDEAAQALNSDRAWLQRLEDFRREASRRCGLGDVCGRVSPKVSLISRAGDGSHIRSRYFIPQACHPAHAVTGALALAVATRCSGTVPSLEVSPASGPTLRISHPSGIIEVRVVLREATDALHLQTLSVTRTARMLMMGHAALPGVDQMLAGF